MLRIFYTEKIQRLRPGLNTRTREPEASMRTTRTPKPSLLLRNFRTWLYSDVAPYGIKTWPSSIPQWKPQETRSTFFFSLSQSGNPWIESQNEITSIPFSLLICPSRKTPSLGCTAYCSKHSQTCLEYRIFCQHLMAPSIKQCLCCALISNSTVFIQTMYAEWMYTTVTSAYMSIRLPSTCCISSEKAPCFMPEFGKPLYTSNRKFGNSYL
jgi:hypothetical protein